MSNKNPLKILLATDGSPHSEAALHLMVRMPWSARTSADVLTVVPDAWTFADLTLEATQVVEKTLADLHHAQRANAETLVARTAAALSAQHLAIETHLCEGQPAEIILQRAANLCADLIVIGAKGLDAPDEFHMGATAHKLVDQAECSVLIARPLEHAQPMSVVLAADGSPEAQRASELLCGLSLPRWADIAVVSVAEARVGFRTDENRLAANVPDSVRRSLLAAAEARASEAGKHLHGCGAAVKRVVRFGHPASEILATAQERDADLIAIGAYGQTRTRPNGAQRVHLGGVAQKVVRYAPCSVLLVR